MSRIQFLCSCLTFAAILVSIFTTQAQTISPNPALMVITTPSSTIAPASDDLYHAGNGSTKDAISTISVSNVTLGLGHHISEPNNNTATQLHGFYALGKRQPEHSGRHGDIL